MVGAPDIIRIQLAVCVSQFVKHYFPGRWPQIVDKISINLQNPTPAAVWTAFSACISLSRTASTRRRRKEDL